MNLTIPSEPASSQLFNQDFLLEGVARQVATDLNTHYSRRRVERAATEHERLRLARELHDGVLQSLTGVALQLRALSQLLEDQPEPVRRRVREVEELVQSEQRELRKWIDALFPKTPAAMASTTDVRTALGALCGRFARWGMRVRFIMPDRGAIPRSLGDQIYWLVQEGLSNAARHAKTETATVELVIAEQRIRLVIDDDGLGFPFKGRYDLALLNTMKIGPQSIKERVEALNGEMKLLSTLSGSRLEITLPVQVPKAPAFRPHLRRA